MFKTCFIVLSILGSNESVMFNLNDVGSVVESNNFGIEKTVVKSRSGLSAISVSETADQIALKMSRCNTTFDGFIYVAK